MRSVEFLIVGQGLAGTCVALELLNRNRSIYVVDPQIQSASKINSGLINPITGRRFTKTWLYEELVQTALGLYQFAENLLGASYFHQETIHRSLVDHQAEERWLTRSIDHPKYMSAITNEFDQRYLPNVNKTGLTTGAFRLDARGLIEDFSNWLLQQGLLLPEQFIYSDLQIAEKKYHDISFEKVLFCEGAGVLENPFFQDHTYAPNVGERLLIECPGLDLDRVIKSKHFLIPWGSDRYWIGSLNRWNDKRPLAQPSSLRQLCTFLDKELEIKYSVLEHHGAVRLTSKDRRPKLLQHSAFSNLYSVNGLGTKGISLAPYCAVQLLTMITDQKN